MHSSLVSFNIIGNPVLADYVDDLFTVKNSVLGIDPLVLSEGEKEFLVSDKGEWIVMDGTLLDNETASYDEDLSVLVKFLRKTWGRKIIFVSNRPSAYCFSENVLSRIRGSPSFASEEASADLIERLSCYTVTMPFECISAGRNQYDYIDEIKQYVRSALEVIVEKYDRPALDRLSARCSATIQKRLARAAEDLESKRKSYLEAVNEGKMDAACSLCADLVSLGDPWAAAVSEKTYLDASKQCRDPSVKEGWIRKFSSGNLSWADCVLFDILYKKNTPEADAEMIELISGPAKIGDSGALGRLGRAYRDGRGVEKDLDKAACCLRKAYKVSKTWVNDLFDVLWKIGTPEASKEMFEAANECAVGNNSGAMGRLGRAYREGRGVEKDLDKSAYYLRKAYRIKQVWGYELFDVLWEMNTVKSDEEMVSIVKNPASKGDVQSMVRMARAYRDGRGVGKDVRKAVSLLEKAVVSRPVLKKELDSTRKLL